MTKVTIHESPEATKPAADKPDVVVDAKGRRLTIQQPSLVNESRLYRIVGDAASNGVYMNAYVLPTAMVIKIDDDPCSFPVNQIQLDAAMNRIGRDGMDAVHKHMIARVEEREGEAQAIKKSSSTESTDLPAG
jgi:hypothetical protein